MSDTAADHGRVNPQVLPAELLDDVAGVLGTEVTVLGRLPGGVNGGALRVQLAGRETAVLKALPRTQAAQLDETLRAQRVVQHMRRRGYSTPAWLGVGETTTHVWHVSCVPHSGVAAVIGQS